MVRARHPGRLRVAEGGERMTSHLPADIQAALDRYDARVANHEIEPWDPDNPQPTEHDEWIRDWLASRIPLDM